MPGRIILISHLSTQENDALSHEQSKWISSHVLCPGCTIMVKLLDEKPNARLATDSFQLTNNDAKYPSVCICSAVALQDLLSPKSLQEKSPRGQDRLLGSDFEP